MSTELAEVQKDVAIIPPKPLTVIERAMSVFVGVPSEENLRELAKGSATITSITNQAGWEQCHAARMVLKNTRLEIARTGESGREDAVQTSRSIIAIQKSRIAITQGEEDRLAAIEKAWDDRIAAEKEAKIQAEISRVAAIQERIAELRGCQTLSPSSGSALIREHIEDVTKIVVDASFEEFEQQASDAYAATIFRLTAIHNAALAHEAEQAKIIAERAELAKLREAEEQRQATARAEQVEKDRLAKIETDRIAREADDKRKAEARANAELVRQEREKVEAEANENRRIARERQNELDAHAEIQRLEAKRLADQQAEIDRQNEALRKAAEPKPEPVKAPVRTVERPTAAQLIALVSGHYGVSLEMAAKWIKAAKIELGKEAA